MSTLTTLVQQLFEQVRLEREELIEFRRDDLTLNAQSVRIERRDTLAREADSQAGGQIESTVVVLGAVDLDVLVGDRFNDSSGNLCEIVHVAPNRLAGTQALATLVQ